MSESDLRFPIGKFQWPESVTPEDRLKHISKIAATPSNLRDAIIGLTPKQLETPYRVGGWTVRQLAHHIPDSHMNSYMRFKLALTEDEPTIKPYDEAAWALLSDTATVPVSTSLSLLESLHTRWVALMRGMSEADWARRFKHPERGAVSLDQNAALYAWHGEHHVEHIRALRRRNGW